MAHYRATQDKKMRLIVMLVGDPPRDQMPDDIQNYIKSGSYLEWGEKWFWKKLIYKMPHVSRDPRPLGPDDYFRNRFMGNRPNGDIKLHSMSFSDDGRGVPLGSFYSDTSEFNETKSEISVENSQFSLRRLCVTEYHKRNCLCFRPAMRKRIIRSVTLKVKRRKRKAIICLTETIV